MQKKCSKQAAAEKKLYTYAHAAKNKYSYAHERVKATLVTLPLTNLKKATEKPCENFYGSQGNTPRKYHLEAVEKAECFKRVHENSLILINPCSAAPQYLC